MHDTMPGFCACLGAAGCAVLVTGSAGAAPVDSAEPPPGSRVAHHAGRAIEAAGRSNGVLQHHTSHGIDDHDRPAAALTAGRRRGRLDHRFVGRGDVPALAAQPRCRDGLVVRSRRWCEPGRAAPAHRRIGLRGRGRLHLQRSAARRLGPFARAGAGRPCRGSAPGAHTGRCRTGGADPSGSSPAGRPRSHRSCARRCW